MQRGSSWTSIVELTAKWTAKTVVTFLLGQLLACNKPYLAMAILAAMCKELGEITDFFHHFLVEPYSLAIVDLFVYS